MEDSQRQLIADFLSHQRLAVVGVSRQPKDFSRSLFQEFLKRGYDAIPVNPGALEIEGRPCYKRASEIQPPPDVALLLTSSEVTPRVIPDLADAGVKIVWMYRAHAQGAISEDAAALCRDRGLRVIAGYCPFMFFPRPGLPHRVHSWFMKLAGSFPR